MVEMYESEHPPVDKSIDAHYIVESAIGSGTFGDVMKARLARDPRRVVALKQLRNINPEPIAMNRLRETIFFKHVRRHPNLVTLYEMFRDPTAATMVFALELMDGTLLQFMDQACRAKPGPLDLFLVGGIIKDLLKGVEHIHASGFVHRDLKPENILFSSEARGKMTIKIADFGLCRPIEEPNCSTSCWTSYVATRWYRAPEQLLGLTFHTPALDIWAVSLILYELCNQVPMFPGRTTIEMTALQVQALQFPAADSIAGPCPAVAHRLAVTDGWKEACGALSPQRWVSLIRWSEHYLFLSPMVSGLQWNASARPSASSYLLEIRRRLQGEWKRRGRMRQNPRTARHHRSTLRSTESKPTYEAFPSRCSSKKRPPTS